MIEQEAAMPQHNDSPSGVQPEPEVTTGDPNTPFPFVTHPMIDLALKTFESELPRLWEQRPGQWVAYHGDKQLGFGKTRTELLHKFWRQGIADDELQVCLIEPLDDEDFIGPRL
jgi:hypothetical protein